MNGAYVNIKKGIHFSCSWSVQNKCILNSLKCRTKFRHNGSVCSAWVNIMLSVWKDVRCPFKSPLRPWISRLTGQTAVAKYRSPCILIDLIIGPSQQGRGPNIYVPPWDFRILEASWTLDLVTHSDHFRPGWIMRVRKTEAGKVCCGISVELYAPIVN